VNIILEGHGHEDHGFLAGNKFLHRDMFRNLLVGFQEKVQVNAICGACYSGRFVDTIKKNSQTCRYAAAASQSDKEAFSATPRQQSDKKNSRFSDAFVQSLLQD
jgi:hypothetical protein